jgi:hypothetical protein
MEQRPVWWHSAGRTKTRQLYSNEEDAKNSLTKQGNIYVGKLPDNIMANTSLMWNGKNWAMIMLPLSEIKTTG